jgi:hypothetical protein
MKLTNKRQGKLEREARKRKKRSVVCGTGSGMVTLKLGRKKLSEYFRKVGFPF